MNAYTEHDLVRAGTSLIRVIQVKAWDLAVRNIESTVETLNIIHKTGTYQDRKLVFFSREGSRVDFRVVQLNKVGLIDWEITECSNSAAAIVHTLIIEGDRVPSFQLRNLGSGQDMTITPQDDSQYRIRYHVNWLDLRDRYRPFEAAGPFSQAWLGDLSNLYVFAKIDEQAFTSAIDTLEVYRHRLTQSGHPLILERKFIVFSPTGDHNRFRAFCHYRGDVHRSMPGSGLMWLGGLLTIEGFGSEHNNDAFLIEHLHGEMLTQNNLNTHTVSDDLWLECTTTARNQSAAG